MEQTEKTFVNFPTTPPLGLLSGDNLVYVTKSGENIGRGSLGAIYGYTISPNTKIAVKFTRNDDEHFKNQSVVRRLDPTHLHEGSVIAELSHPNLVSLLDIFTYSDGIGLVIPRYTTSLKRFNKLTYDLAILFSYQIALGLDYVHSKHWIHADLKPENILVDEENKKVVIADFGFAKIAPDCETRKWNRPEGYTPRYVAPEVSLGMPQDYPVDVWSYGCIVFFLFYKGYLFNPRYPVETEKEKKKKDPPLIKFAFLVDIYNAVGLPTSQKWKEAYSAKNYNQSLKIYNVYKTIKLEPKENKRDFNGESLSYRIDKLKQYLKKENHKIQEITQIINLIEGCIKLIPSDRVDMKTILKSLLFSSFKPKSSDEISCIERDLQKVFPIPELNKEDDENEEQKYKRFVDRSFSILQYLSDKIFNTSTFLAIVFADYGYVDTNIPIKHREYSSIIEEAREIRRALVDRRYTELQHLYILDSIIISTECKLYSASCFDILYHIRKEDTENDDDQNLLLLIYLTDVPFHFSQIDIALSSWLAGDIDSKSPILDIFDLKDIEDTVEEVLTHTIEYLEALDNNTYIRLSKEYKKITGISIKEIINKIGIDY